MGHAGLVAEECVCGGAWSDPPVHLSSSLIFGGAHGPGQVGESPPGPLGDLRAGRQPGAQGEPVTREPCIERNKYEFGTEAIEFMSDLSGKEKKQRLTSRTVGYLTEGPDNASAVSYTHLTLPTICSV